MPAIEFRILGPLEVLNEGKPVELGGTKQRALLAVLLVHVNEVVSTDRLIEDVWGEHPPDSAANAVQVHVSTLRKAFEPDRTANSPPQVLITRKPGYLLQLGEEHLDALRFEHLHQQGRAALGAGDPRAASNILGRALALWRGPALADFAYESFAQAPAARLEEHRLTAIEDRIEADLALGHHYDLAGELEALVGQHPFRERLTAQLMVVLYRSGRQAEALRVYQALRQHLAEELGIDPNPSLQRLEEAVLRQSPELEWSPPTEAATTGPRPADRTALPAVLRRREQLPFAGRETQLARLRRVWHEVLEDEQIRLVWVAGEPGIGKSRLVTEFAVEVFGENASVLHGRCAEEISIPYQPFVEALRYLVTSAPQDLLEDHVRQRGAGLARLVPELAARVKGPSDSPIADAESERYGLFEAVGSLLGSASRRSPVLVFLEDVHWAEQPTLLLLRHLVRWPEPAAVMFVATYRDTELVPAGGLAGSLADLSREPGVERLVLAGLDDAEVVSLVEGAAGRDLSDGEIELARTLTRRTEGNPFFIRELLRHLIETGALEQVDGHWDAPAASIDLVSIPPGVKDVIGWRVGRLSQGAQQVLTSAAVVGPEFDASLLERVEGTTEEAIIKALDEVAAARLAIEVPGTPGRYAFSHALVREALYEGLSGMRRARLHRRVAGALEEATGPGRLSELAHHLFRAGGPDLARAIEYGRRAGEQALGQLAYEDAVVQFGRALSAAEATDAGSETRCDLLLALGLARWRAGEEAGSREAFRSAAELARMTPDPERLATSAVGAAGLGFEAGAVDTAAVPLLEEALANLAPDPSVLRVRVLAALARCTSFARGVDEAAAVSADAVEMARMVGHGPALADSLAARFWAVWAMSADECTAVADELTQVVQGSPDLAAVVEARVCHLLSRLQVADLQGTLHDLAAIQALASQSRQPRHRWYATAWEATLAIMEGRFEDGQRLANEALNLGHPLRGPAAVASFMTHISPITLAQGAIGEDVLPGLDVLTTVAGPNVAFVEATRVWILAEVGRTDEARRQLAELASAGFGASFREPSRLGSLTFLATACDLVGASEHAPELRHLLLPHADRMLFIPVWLAGGAVAGPIAHYLGCLACLTEDWEEAFGHFETALQRNRQLQARPWVARTAIRYAEGLAERGRPEDLDRATSLLGEATALVEAIGMPHFGRRADATAARLAGRSPRSTS